MPDIPIPADARARLAGTLLAALVLLMGGFIAGIGLEWVPYDPAKIHAPRWVILVCGLVFVSGGLAALSATWSRDAQPRPIFGVAILIGLTLVCHWVAFGVGEREFTATTSVNDTVIDSRAVSDRGGRMVFGAVAVILDLVLIAVVAGQWRKRRESHRAPAG